MIRFSVCFAACAFLASAAPPAKIAPVRFLDTKLDNGLRVIIAEDHFAPVYAIAVAYGVGSKDERKGRTGFAHLFEHMMFKGSENVGPGEHFFLVFNYGGGMNGTTNTDRTNYFETLPKNQLDLGLFLESDRMRSLVVTKENLDNQRNAVQEERRLGIDNQPYGRTFERMGELIYDNFAYKHSVIGSMDDLNAATVDDVKDFFRTYYAPNNAVVVLVGDLDPKETLEKVKKYFGAIPRQDPPKQVDLAEPPQPAERREKLDDKLARVARVDIAYKTPSGASPDADALYVANQVLTGGEGSRLFQKLVKEKEVATQVFGFVDDRMGPGTLRIGAMIRPGKTPEEVEALISEEVAKLHAAPVTPKELERARMTIRRGAIQTRESALQRAVAISDAVVKFNDPNRINTQPERRLAVTAARIQDAARKHLKTENRTVIHTIPAPPKSAAGGGKGAAQ